MQEKSYKDILINAPADDKSLPHVTPAILIDYFGSDQVLLGDSISGNWLLRWFVPLSNLDTEYLEKSPVQISQLLVVAEPKRIPELCEQFPTAFFITEIENENQLDELIPYKRKLIALKSQKSKEHLLLKLQNLFLQMLLWESGLERIVLKQGTLGELLDASTAVIGNFIFISDNDFNVVAVTSTIDPPDDLHASIISNGCLTQNTIAEKRFRLPEKTFYTRSASSICPFDRVSYPIHLSHTYYGSVSMACNKRPDTPGLRDLFKILIRHIRTVCEREWINQTSYNLPSYFFFEKLLQHAPMTEEYFVSQMEINKLPIDGHFKIIVFDVDPSIDPELAYRTMRAASTLHNGHTKCFQYQHNVIAFCYGSGIDGELSHKKTLDDVDGKIRRPLNVECGISSVYHEIQNSDLAFKQARIALAFRGAIEREMEANDSYFSHGAYLFEDALLYYLIDPTNKDTRFINFIFNVSVVGMLWEEDNKNGTNYVALLWIYLQSERNATVAAQKLHMHRNTVLYHIDKLQKRFDFDMDNKAARDWLLINFKVFFSSQSRESLSSLFEDDEPKG